MDPEHHESAAEARKTSAGWVWLGFLLVTLGAALMPFPFMGLLGMPMLAVGVVALSLTLGRGQWWIGVVAMTAVALWTAIRLHACFAYPRASPGVLAAMIGPGLCWLLVPTVTVFRFRTGPPGEPPSALRAWMSLFLIGPLTAGLVALLARSLPLSA